MLMAFPGILFFFMLVGSILSPSEINGVFNALSQASAEDIRTVGLLVTYALLFCWIGYVAFGVVFGLRWGWSNIFDNTINNSIRMAIGVKAEGCISLYKSR